MKSSEAIPLYIVRFMRLDDYPDEEYNYIRKSDAEKHFSMYATDNSGLYYEIQLSEVRNKTAKILNAEFDPGSGQVPKGSVGMGETAAAEFAW